MVALATSFPLSPAWKILCPPITPSSLALQYTLCGGQCFRWRQVGTHHSWLGVVQENVIELRFMHVQEGGENTVTAVASRFASQHPPPLLLHYRFWSSNDTLRHRTAKPPSPHNETNAAHDITSSSECTFLNQYLSLDMDASAVWKRWTSVNPLRDHPLVQRLESQFQPAVESESVSKKPKTTKKEERSRSEAAVVPPLLRILRQDPHETLFAFICSQNNHLKRITTMVESLCVEYGTPLVHLVEDSDGELQYYNNDEVETKTKRSEGGSLERKRARSGERAVASSSSSSSSIPVAGKDQKRYDLYSFPTITQLKNHCTEDRLRKLGFGYRCTFIVTSTSQVAGSVITIPQEGPDEKKDNTTSTSHDDTGKGKSKKKSASASTVTGKTSPFLGAGTSIANSFTNNTLMPLQENAQCTLYATLTSASASTDAKRAALMALHGVGRKVADCILLFSCGCRDVVPIDTHMAQISVECLLKRKADSQSLLRNAASDNRVPSSVSTVFLTERQEAVHMLSAKQHMDCLLSLCQKQREAAKEGKQVLLTPSHHASLQWAYHCVFGDECGWAHSCLFTERMLNG